MVSTVTQSRKDYLREKAAKREEERKCFRDRRENSTIDNQPGPSGFQNTQNIVKPRLNHYTVNGTNKGGSELEKEKENKFLRVENVHDFGVPLEYWDEILRIYENCVKNEDDYQSNAGKRVFKPRERFSVRNHPYKNYSNFSKNSAITNSQEPSTCTSSYYRLRTTSLSSGSKKKPSSAEKRPPGNGFIGRNRSRSMENLSGNLDSEYPVEVPSVEMGMDLCSMTGNSKPKDLEYVSRGIQQLKMEDCT